MELKKVCPFLLDKFYDLQRKSTNGERFLLYVSTAEIMGDTVLQDFRNKDVKLETVFD